DELRERVAVGLQIGDGTGGDARRGGGFGHGGGDAQDQARVKRRGDEVVGAEAQFHARIGARHLVGNLGFGQVGDLAHAGQLHGFGDLGGAAIQGAAEDVGEAQDVVD